MVSVRQGLQNRLRGTNHWEKSFVYSSKEKRRDITIIVVSLTVVFKRICYVYILYTYHHIILIISSVDLVTLDFIFINRIYQRISSVILFAQDGIKN